MNSINKVFEKFEKDLDDRIDRLIIEKQKIPEIKKEKRRELARRRLIGRIKEIKHLKSHLNQLQSEIQEIADKLSQWSDKEIIKLNNECANAYDERNNLQKQNQELHKEIKLSC